MNTGEDTNNDTSTGTPRQGRRRVLALSGAALVPAGIASLTTSSASAGVTTDGHLSAEATTESETCPAADTGPFDSPWTEGPTQRLLAGTKYETGVYIQEADNDGPTALVVAGQHGTERAAQDAAMGLARLTPQKGKVVVIPHADMTAINGHTYSGDSGNLNRHWPAGEEPSSTLARAIWGVVERHEPDVAFDLHTSKGVYADDNDLADGVGQALFPTGPGEETAKTVIDALNEYYIAPSAYTDGYEFTQGNTQTGANPLLSHKYGADLDIPAWLIEATRYRTTLPDRTEWLMAAVTGCLGLHGITYD